MKHISLVALTAAALCSCAVKADHEPKYKTWVGGFAEYYNPDDDKPEPTGYLDDGHGFGGEVGFRFKPQWAARLEWSNLDLDTKDLPPNVEPNNAGPRIGIDGMYFLEDDLMYIFAGLKNANIGDNHQLANVGIGKHWDIHESWKIISEAAAYQSFDDNHTDFGLKLGVAYVFGGHSGSSGPKDSDRDGVYDSQDQCPNTPVGTRVDAVGCDIDQDKDGVVNSMDQCPNTPAGTVVDARGCDADADKDGVTNDMDACPNTPAGTPVGAKGCSLAVDADQDGVLDSDDRCANTPLTDKVDAVGCSVFVEKAVSVALNVLFANNSADVTNSTDAQFQEFADFMQRFPNTQATIEGHTSAVGDEGYNQRLSEQRASAVKAVLVDEYGIAESRLTAVGYGETRLLDDSGSAAAATLNRRIEAVVTAMEKVVAERE